MKVKELIKRLEKFPGNTEVGWQDHDSSEGELSNRIGSVSAFYPDGSQSKDWTHGITVVLRP